MPLLILIFFLAFSGLLFPAFAQSDSSTRHTRNIISLGIRYGPGTSAAKGFDSWLLSEGLSPNGTEQLRHRVLGFDVLYQRRRIPFLLSTQLQLSSLRNAYPWLFDMSLQSGYSFIQNETWELTGLLGPALGEVYVRFRRGTPNSFGNLRNRYVDPYAKSSFLAVKPSLWLRYSPEWATTKRGHKLSFQCTASYMRIFSQGGWLYGERDVTREPEGFEGEAVDMPRFLSNNFSASLGLLWNFAL